MSKLIFAFPLVCLLPILPVDRYVQVTSSTLSLPISTATTILTILLPLFAAANVIYTPFLNHLTGSSTLQQLLLPALHIIQGGLAIIIATLAVQGFAPGQTLYCSLEGNWQRLWHSHDHRAIERIQNTFDCCGFHSVVDRSWPQQQCSDIYDRHTSCDRPWGAAMQRTSGLEFTVAVLAGIIQVSPIFFWFNPVQYVRIYQTIVEITDKEKLAHLAYLRRRGAGGTTAHDFKRVPQRVEEGPSERLIEEPYHDGDEDGAGVNHNGSQSATSAARDNAPRVEPSGLGRDEANEWRS
ncbi:hypothetical protein CHU98_g5284 [Xylaria longipes]|nr:hypothetical protein CHU98_g5284 [Xylaria longipes]